MVALAQNKCFTVITPLESLFWRSPNIANAPLIEFKILRPTPQQSVDRYRAQSRASMCGTL